MAERSRLPVEHEAYQQQCWIRDENGSWQYSGFRCPAGNTDCPLKIADGLDEDEAIKKIRGLFELDHNDGSRFSKVHSTLCEQVTMRCKQCHTQRHANDPSASRLKWK